MRGTNLVRSLRVEVDDEIRHEGFASFPGNIPGVAGALPRVDRFPRGRRLGQLRPQRRELCTRLSLHSDASEGYRLQARVQIEEDEHVTRIHRPCKRWQSRCHIPRLPQLGHNLGTHRADLDGRERRDAEEAVALDLRRVLLLAGDDEVRQARVTVVVTSNAPFVFFFTPCNGALYIIV